MSVVARPAPPTRLRASYERIRALPPEVQLRECIDQLGNPEILVSEFLEAACEVEARLAAVTSPPAAAPDAGELMLEYFSPGRVIDIAQGSAAGFTCLASNVDPLRRTRSADDGERDGLDYVGLGPERTPACLGAVQSERDRTPYLVLLRLLACASELAPAAQRQWLDRELCGGRIGPEARFDLHLVLWQGESSPLHELARDLAEVVKEAALDDPLFPRMLEGIAAFQMDPDAFEGKLLPAWRV